MCECLTLQKVYANISKDYLLQTETNRKPKIKRVNSLWSNYSIIIVINWSNGKVTVLLEYFTLLYILLEQVHLKKLKIFN